MDDSAYLGRREQVDAVLRAADVLLRVAAKSVMEVEDIVTSPQLRVLVLIAFHGPQNLSGVARELGVHASNATRTCERLAVAGLISRSEYPPDRRFLQIDLTPLGRKLVESVIDHRRRAIADVLEHVPEGLRVSVAAAMAAFADADGGQGTEDGRFTLGPQG